MCAIAGIVGSSPELPALVPLMTNLLRHRGPDDEGHLVAGSGGAVALGGQDTPQEVYHFQTPYRPTGKVNQSAPPFGAWVALGHRRLSIVDLSPLGHQPMSYGGRYWIVYNGEVYNHLELRVELEKLGHRFISHCDTEVILAAYAQWGTGCFQRFNGMWGLAIYDREEAALVLARDRFGVKPLYLWGSAGMLAFASEIKAFTALPGWRPSVNGQAVHDFLLSGAQDHSRETMFSGVYQLEPGCFARLDCRKWAQAPNGESDRVVQTTRWYELRPRAFSGGWEDAAEGFRELLTDSVRLRLRSDVPVGSCLSGGLDSSSIVCVANGLLRAENASGGQQTFSSCSEIKRFDEREYVEKVVAATGVKSNYTFPTGEGLFKNLDALTWHQDEPFASTSIFAQWCVFRTAAEARVKVMLDGQGADELLYGYSHFQRAFIASLIGGGDWRGAWQESMALRGKASKAASVFMRGMTDTAIPAGLQVYFRNRRQNRRQPAWFSRDALKASYPGPLEAPFQQHQNVRQLSVNMLGGAHLQQLLHWEDRNSMAHSIESRVPFLDYRLAEYILGLPDRFKIRNGMPKAVLREGMKNLVPSAVLERRDKMGFVTAEQVWACGENSAAFKAALAEAVDSAKGIIVPEAKARLARIQSGTQPYDSGVWRVISFGRWMKQFNIATC